MTPPPAARPALSWRIVATLADWAEAEAAWQALGRRGAAIGLFQTYEWLNAWWQAVATEPGLAGRTALRVVVLSDKLGPVAIAPLALDRGRLLPRLGWMAVEVSDYCDLIAAPDGDPATIGPALRAAMAQCGAALAVLGQVPPDGPGARLLGPYLRADGRPAARSPFVELAGRSWAEVERGFSAALRKDVRRNAKRLVKRAPWRYVECDTPEQRRVAIDFVLRHKARQLANDARALARHERLFAPIARDAFVRMEIGAARPHVAVIETDGRPIAAHLGFVDADRFYYYVPTYDPEFQAYAPGHILLFELIRRATETGVPIFDLLRGDYAYKWRLTDKAVDLRSYAEPLGVLGSTFLRMRRMVSDMRGLLRRASGGNGRDDRR